MKTPSGRPAAFFDLDRTLLDINSGASYATFETGRGASASRTWVARVLDGLYSPSLIDMDRAYRRRLLLRRSALGRAGTDQALVRCRDAHPPASRAAAALGDTVGSDTLWSS